MKRVSWLVVFAGFIIILSCKNPVLNADQSGGLVIRGTISSDVEKSVRSISQSAGVFSKAILFYNNSYEEHSINNGELEIPIFARQPAGIIFASSTNEFMGYVSFSNGTNSLPLNTISETDKVIDLGNMTPINSVLNTQIDIDGTLGIGTERKSKIAMASKLFNEVIKNPDYDKNGVIDILEGKKIHIALIYYINNNSFFGDQLTPATPSTSMVIKSHKFAVTISNPSLSQVTDAILTVPSLATYSKTGIYSSASKGRFYFQAISGLPAIGAYSVEKDNSKYTFDITSDYYSEKNVIVMVPTITLNTDSSTIKSISWKSFDADMKEISNPNDVLTSIQLQIDVINPSDYGISNVSNPNRVYDSPLLDINETTHTLTKNDIKWSDVKYIFVTYYDMYGNNYVNQYSK